MARITVGEISGMGGRKFGGYEWGCQVLCLRALRFLNQQKSEQELPKHTEYENIIGVAAPANAKARELDKFMLDHPALKQFGVTGAMHQFSLAHAKKLFEVGREKYLQELRDAGRTPDDFFEFDEADAFPEDK